MALCSLAVLVVVLALSQTASAKPWLDDKFNTDDNACISEPLRVIHYALDPVRRLFCNRETGRRQDTAKGTERETVNTAEERTGQKEPAAADYFDDYIKEQAEWYLQNWFHTENYDASDHEEVDPDWPLPSLAIYYDGDSSNGNLLLRAQGKAIEDAFQIKIEIPDGDNGIDYGYLVFGVNPYACNKVITRTIVTGCCRKIDVAFVPLYCAIQARVCVILDFIAVAGSSTGGNIYYVYGEITAHHQFYDDKNAMLFYCEEGNKAEVVGGELPLLRSWAAVPVYLDPLLIIKLSLHVSTNPEHDPDGQTISFQGDLTFDRDQYKKSICNVQHGVVTVHISYE
ncbi:hypothetical protein D1007_59789 [Hordeum vulgare]|nr:hypothetical protein D1007_59789 [Hordeum vulgare]